MNQIYGNIIKYGFSFISDTSINIIENTKNISISQNFYKQNCLKRNDTNMLIFFWLYLTCVIQWPIWINISKYVHDTLINSKISQSIWIVWMSLFIKVPYNLNLDQRQCKWCFFEFKRLCVCSVERILWSNIIIWLIKRKFFILFLLHTHFTLPKLILGKAFYSKI